jgi:hypothetical protein
MFMPAQTILPLLPSPSSSKVSSESEATASASVLVAIEYVGWEVPMAFFAVTANVYAVLGCKPSKLKVPPVACVRVRVIPPGFEVAVYEVTAEPPFEAGGPKLTVALRLPVAVATTEVGEDGAPTVVVELEALDATEVPAEFVAVTVNV